MTDYKVELDVYNGPLDLLLFLIRREEVEIQDIPISRILQQYIATVDLIESLDSEAVGDFLVLAATLMEIKSRMLLPTPPPEEGDDEILDPRFELVRQLLEYKKFKDAARYLDQAAEEQSQKYARSPAIAPMPADEVELENLDIWDLFDAFNSILEKTGKRSEVRRIGIDETPITLHADDILDSIDRSGGAQKFEEIFMARTKPEMIGLFLALLELIRQRRISVRQDKPFGTIWVHLLEKKSIDIQLGTDDDPQESPETGEMRRADQSDESSGNESSGAYAGDDDTSYPSPTAEDSTEENAEDTRDRKVNDEDSTDDAVAGEVLCGDTTDDRDEGEPKNETE